jgi:hypothetical protein
VVRRGLDCHWQFHILTHVDIVILAPLAYLLVMKIPPCFVLGHDAAEKSTSGHDASRTLVS